MYIVPATRRGEKKGLNILRHATYFAKRGKHSTMAWECSYVFCKKKEVEEGKEEEGLS